MNAPSLPLFDTQAAPTGDVARDVARRTLAMAIAMGVATEALFWGAPIGLDWLVWNALATAASVLAFAPRSRGRIRPGLAASSIVAACLALAACVVARRSEWTISIAVPANVALLSLLPVTLRARASFVDLGDAPLRALRSLGRAPRAALETARLPLDAVDARDRGHARSIAIGVALGAPITAVFVALLATDPAFASALHGAGSRLESATTFGGASLLAAIGYVVVARVHAAQEAAPPKGEPIAPYRSEATPFEGARVLSPLAWTVVVAQVAAVFVLFAIANRRDLFGDHAFIRSPGAPSYARHLHAGFYELLLATALSVCLVVAGHRLLRGRGATTVPGGMVARVAESSLLLATSIALLSCRHRLALYEDAYGASYLRLGVAFATIAIAALLACTLVKSIARSFRGFGACVLATGACVAIAAAGFDADGYVARTNLDRAARGFALDVDYLERLGPDACVALDHPIVRADAALEARLAARWREAPPRDLRGLRGLRRCGAEAR